jgi:hypothetical protein
MQQSSSTNSRASSRHPHPDRIFPYAHPQPEALLSPAFFQSPSTVPSPPPTFPTPFSTAQYDYPSQSTPPTYPPNLSPPNWQRQRATSSYALESATLAFPEPQLHRATSNRAISRPPPPPPPPRTPSRHVETVPHTSPVPPYLNSAIGPKVQDAKVAFTVCHERHRLCIFFA